MREAGWGHEFLRILSANLEFCTVRAHPQKKRPETEATLS